MQVLVTGASGFIGSHLTAALTAAGHRVRAFVRSVEKLSRALQPFGPVPVEAREGDVTDQEAVASAVEGCDAVVNAANVYSYDPRMAETMHETNVVGTGNVLSAAVAAGCDPIVHISTAQISWPRVADDPSLAPLAPLSGLAYSDSKKRAELVAREWQDQGAPVVTTYPGGVFGPHDPGPGEQATLLQTVLGPTAPFRIEGGFPACDIDWLVAVHVGLIQEGLGPRRVTCSGRYVTWEEWFDLARRLTERDLRNRLPAPGWLIGALGATMDTLQRVVPSRLPFGREPGWILRYSYGYPDEEAIAIAGPYPPFEETFSRAVRWAVEAGHVSAEQAGALIST
jgi:nucleoside-diphosphate-sugar epimerase